MQIADCKLQFSFAISAQCTSRFFGDGPHDAQVITGVWFTPGFDQVSMSAVDDLKKVLAAVEATGGIAYSSALAAAHGKAAISALDDLPDSPFKDALVGIARFATQRTH